MSVEELAEEIEAAEEAADVTKLLSIIVTCTKNVDDEDWTEVAESSLDAYYRLVKGGSSVPLPLSDDASCLDQLFLSLKGWKDEEAIVEVALGCIVSTVTWMKNNSTTNNATDYNTNLDFYLIIAIMKSFQDESTIQEQACLALEALALTSDAIKAEILSLEGLKEELVAAKERISNERNKAYPGRAAAALGIEL
mmetsp:Transcript_16564/g.21679  ORF Transcript_16564/g.21679 Transcript_16564/m.21679 type:complete len:195 (-) Transcript_16564:329-913(-)|eukprot:CAMPEP_0198154968 /NCGR_PEP_ID=MMETSP1443-20131203/68884_1 /TAXON_ID=186043 /ORGANISM="Entomoneis sp., Strain CCMP2396" /LENGTH=194 /DNA_ID=CAMNT_0043821687 /DNA_START=538 /DNA_END=1122 /DNA_ORIENTATION=-